MVQPDPNQKLITEMLPAVGRMGKLSLVRLVPWKVSPKDGTAEASGSGSDDPAPQGIRSSRRSRLFNRGKRLQRALGDLIKRGSDKDSEKRVESALQAFSSLLSSSIPEDFDDDVENGDHLPVQNADGTPVDGSADSHGQYTAPEDVVSLESWDYDLV